MDNPDAQIKDNQLLFILLGMSMLLVFSYSWVPGGLDLDSCNYGVIAREVMRSARWLGIYDPIYRAAFYYHFPLCIWVTAGLFKLFGASTFTAKVFSMSSAVALVAVIFYFGRMLANKWAGFFAAVSFLATNHIVRIARKCRMDLPLCLFITLAIFSFIMAQRRSRRYYLLFGLFTCLAIFTKDVAGLAPLAIAFIYFVLCLKWRELFNPYFLLGVVIAAAPVLFWIWLDKAVLFNAWFSCNFLHLLKAQRFNVPWYYYGQAILTKYFYLLPFAVYGGYLAIREANRNKNYELYILIIWTLIFPLAFSFGRQKLHYFILPMYPATALLAGIAFDKIFRERIKLKIARLIKYILLFAGIVMLCFPVNAASGRFKEAVRLSPAVDRLIKQLPEYEFILYKQDQASMLFYSQELKRATSILEMGALEEALKDSSKVKLCYISERDFSGLSQETQKNLRVILKYKDRLILVNQKDSGLLVILP